MDKTLTSKMDTRITIEKRAITKVKGMQTENWTEYYSCWSEVLDLFGREKYDAYNAKIENSLKFKCRTCLKLKDINFHTKDYRILWNGTPFNIIFVDTLNNSKTEIILQGQVIS